MGAQVIVIGSDAGKLGLAESIGADILIDRSKDENWSKSVYLTPYQVRRGQSDDQANGNESDHAMDPRITEEPRLDFLPAVRL